MKGNCKPVMRESKESRARYQTAYAPIKDADGTLLKDNAKILMRWAEYYASLFNSSNSTDQSVIEELPQMPVVSEMDVPPTLEEVRTSIGSLKNDKAPGPDGLPSEIFKHGGEELETHLLKIFQRC